MRKRYRDFKSQDENVFAVSTGDLMASLLFIFILLLAGALLQVQEKSEQDERIAGAYNEIKEKIYEALKAEFSPEELREWHARIDRDTLTILFQEPRIAFEEGEYKIKPRFQKMLDDFFPRYVNVLLSRDGGGAYVFREHITENRIEGHTNSKGGYFYNMNLSQNRASEVLKYCMMQKSLSEEQRGWLEKTFTANGMAYSHPILRDSSGEICPEAVDAACPGAKEDQELSKRVEFRVRTDAERQLEDIAERRKQGIR